MARTVLGWKFFGPRSAGIASHHVAHLYERFEMMGITGEASAVQEGPMAWFAQCTVADEHAAELIRILKPQAHWPESLTQGEEATAEASEGDDAGDG